MFSINKVLNILLSYIYIQVGSVKGQVRLLSVEGRLRIEKELKVAGDEPGQVL